ncbi:MAG: hypothetical protein IIY78_07255 [Clostridia bacterium]|nr:hypothetical protein [Clostridia bacterium]
MSNYSHRGYEHRTGTYGRRRKKASGFRSKNKTGKAAQITALVTVVIFAFVLLYLFADNISPFVHSIKSVERPPVVSEPTKPTTADTPESSNNNIIDKDNVNTQDIPLKKAEGYFDYVNKKIFISNGSGYTIFKGIDVTAKNYAAVLNSISSSVPSKVKLCAAVIPTKTDVSLDGVIEGSHSQSENINIIKNSLSDNVNFINIIDMLIDYNDEYLYYRTDGALTAMGGYYVYNAVAPELGVDVKSIYTLSELSKKKGSISPFYGEYSASTTDKINQPNGNIELYKNSDTVEYYKLPVHYNCYKRSLDGSYSLEYDLFKEINISDDPLEIFPSYKTPLLYIENTQKNNDNKLLVVKDHAAEPLIGYLVPHFKEVHCVDVSLLGESVTSYINKNEITHILIINGIEDANNSLYCQRLRDLFDNSISN